MPKDDLDICQAWTVVAREATEKDERTEKGEANFWEQECALNNETGAIARTADTSRSRFGKSKA